MKFGIRVVAIVLALAFQVRAEAVHLPSQGLESRIEFWKKIYTQYGKDDIVVHDRFHVNLIYDVANEDNVDSKINFVKAALSEIRENLSTPENLSLTSKQISEVIVANGLSISDSVLQELRDNIHTQRGIKERFREGVIRSGRYLDLFQGIIEKQ